MGEPSRESHIRPMRPVRSEEEQFFITQGQPLKTHVAEWLQLELFLLVPG